MPKAQGLLCLDFVRHAEFGTSSRSNPDPNRHVTVEPLAVVDHLHQIAPLIRGQLGHQPVVKDQQPALDRRASKRAYLPFGRPIANSSSRRKSRW